MRTLSWNDACNQVLELLTQVAPEVAPEEVETSVDLREQLDLDSMDFLNFLIAINRQFGIEIPEADYSRLSSVDIIVDYILEQSAESSKKPGETPG